MNLNLLVAWLVHGRHSWTVELARVALDVDFERHGPHGRLEVVQAHLLDAQPVGEIARIRQRCRQAHNSDGILRVVRDEVGAWHDHFQDGATVFAQQVDLVYDYESYIFYVVSCLPAAWYAVFEHNKAEFDLGNNLIKEGSLLVLKQSSRKLNYQL